MPFHGIQLLSACMAAHDSPIPPDLGSKTAAGGGSRQAQQMNSRRAPED